RTYTAVVFDFSRADDGLWFGAGSVTWSKSIGSTEGTVKSDAGNGAQDGSGATQDFDYTGLDDYNYGLLPNDRRWTFKLYGALHATRALTLGANVFVQSGGHGSCQSIHPTNDFAAGYGASSFYCPTGVLTAKGNYPYASIVPGGRGIGPRGDWIKQLDLSARYNIPLGRSDNQRLTLRADVFNVFNSHAVRQRYVESVTGQCTTTTPTCDVGDYIPNPTYNTPLSYQPPRHVRLGLDLMWGGSPALPPVVEAVLPPPPPPPAMQTCPDGSMIAADAMCPVPPPPPPPPAPVERGERGQ
ncbi:MAG: hypothetical protein ABIO80_07510, partial [Sphingomicrobium sp.]